MSRRTPRSLGMVRGPIGLIGGGGPMGGASDGTPPSAPGTPALTVLSSSAIFLSWAASTDNVAVSAYEVERRLASGGSFAVVATLGGGPPATSHTDSGLTASTAYEYRVRARDAAGNFSSYSGTSTATTLAPAGASDLGPVIDTARVFVTGHSLSSHQGQFENAGWPASLGVSHQWERQIVNGSIIEFRTSGSPSDTTNWPGFSRGENSTGTDNLDCRAEWMTPSRVTGGKYTHLLITERHDILGPLAYHDTMRHLMAYCETFADRASDARLMFWHPWKESVVTGLTGATAAAWINYEKITLRAWEAIVARINLTAANKDFSWRLENVPAAYLLARLVEEAIAGNLPGITGTPQSIIDQIFNDGGGPHPTTALGKYWSICVHAAAVHRKNIIGMAFPAGVTATQANSVQTLVWNELVAYYNGTATGSQLSEQRPTMSTARSYMDTVHRPAWAAHMGYDVFGAGFFVGTNNNTNPFFFDAATDTASFGWFTPPALFASNNWDQPATWGGSVPGAGATVTIAPGQTVILNTDTAALGALTVNGTLRLDGKSATSLTASSITIGSSGQVVAGSEASPWSGRCTVTLTGTGTARHITLTGAASLDLHAIAPTHRAVLNANANAGATVLAVDLNRQEVTPPIAGVSQPLPRDEIHLKRWYQNHEIAVGPSDWYSVGRSEVRSLGADAVPGQITLATGLSRFRWGAKQYVFETSPGVGGVSLTRQQSFPALTGVPAALAMPHEFQVDERAPLVNLSRRIVIQAPNDSEWTTNGNGVCIVPTSRTGTCRLNGVVLRRCGQRGVQHKYPVHYSLLSHVAGSSTDLGAVPAGRFYTRNCVIRDSENRGVVFRGTRGAELTDSVLYNIKGHAIYGIEGTERRNIVGRNVTMTVDAPSIGNRLASHERPWTEVGDVNNEACVSGMVWANLDNDWFENWHCDSQGHGFWLGPARDAPLGDTSNVPIAPNQFKEGDLRANVMHSNRGYNGLARGHALALTGPTVIDFLDPRDNSLPSGTPTRTRLEEMYMWKGRGYANRVKWAIYHRWNVSSPMGRALFGAALDEIASIDGIRNSLIDRPFLVGRTLNNANEPNWDGDPLLDQNYTAGASYHFGAIQRQAVIVNFPHLPGLRSSGGIDQSDLYIRAVEKGWVQGDGNRYINSIPGMRNAPPALGGIGSGSGSTRYTLSGAIWDLWGYYGPIGWNVYDIPFLTDGVTKLSTGFPTDSLTGVTACNVAGGESAYIEIREMYLHGRTNYDTAFYPRLPIEVRRLQSDYVTSVGGPDWTVEDGFPDAALTNMRHAALREGGRFRLRFPGISPLPQTGLDISFNNLYHGSGQSVMLGISWDCSINPANSFFSSQFGGRTRAANSATYRRDLTAAASRAAVEAGGGNLYWLDVPNNLMWVKCVGDMNNAKSGDATDVYKSITLVVIP